MLSCPMQNAYVPQRKELRVQPDRRRQAVWAVPGAKSTARQSAEWVVPESYSRYADSKHSAASLPEIWWKSNLESKTSSVAFAVNIFSLLSLQWRRRLGVRL